MHRRMKHRLYHLEMSGVRRSSKEGGFILITSYILIAGLLTTVFSYFSRSFYDFDLAQRRLSRLQALYTAESGAERAIEGMKGTIPVLQPDCGQSNPETSTPYSNTNLGTEGTYTVRITNDCTSPNQIYWIRSTGTFDNVTREMRISVRLTNLANYAIASDHMDPDTYFQSAFIVGPLHINGPIQVYGSPVFYGKVSSSASEIYYYNNNTASDGYTPTGGDGSWTAFKREFTVSRPAWVGEPHYPLLNQPRILFPPADVSSLKKMALTQVVNQKMWIRFNGDGTYNYSTRGPIAVLNPGLNRPMPPKGSVVYFEPINPSSTAPAVVVRGTIDRDITLASSQDIGIDGNLNYKCTDIWATSTTAVYATLCSDKDPKLAVISAKNIVHLPETEPVPPKLINGGYYPAHHRVLAGAFMALGGGMTVPDPKTTVASLGGGAHITVGMDVYDNRGPVELRIYGSLIEHEFKPKQLLSGGYQRGFLLYTERTGFSRLEVHRDPRLDLASLPTSMKQAMSIVSWEACDGSCS